MKTNRTSHRPTLRCPEGKFSTTNLLFTVVLAPQPHPLLLPDPQAHPLLMLASALEQAKPGDRLLLAGFGQGCDVLGFEVTDKIKNFRPARGASGSLAAMLAVLPATAVAHWRYQVKVRSQVNIRVCYKANSVP